MKVIVTGSGGQLGRALIAAAPASADVLALPRAALDLADPASVERVIEREQPDLVINAAAYTAVDRAESGEGEAVQVNGSGVETLAAACERSHARLIHLSTDFVFDGEGSRPYRPEDRPAPRSAYGRSKLLGETAALASGGNLVVRTAWVYGNHGYNFVKTLLRLFRERDEIRVVADQVGTPTHAASLARAIWNLATQKADGLHHFTDAGVASWYDFAVAIQEEALGLQLLDRAVSILPIVTSDYPTPAQRPAYSVLDKSSCWALLGYPARHWRVELREMLEAEKRLHG